jgi:diguanylate cyclase (GGDEF)-like protein
LIIRTDSLEDCRIVVTGEPLVRLTSDPRHHPVPLRASSAIPTVAAALAVVGGLLAIFALDRASGSAPVQHLYYLPIILAAMRFGTPGGLAAAIAAIVLYHVANPLLLLFQYRELDLVEVVLFVAVGLITARLVRDGRRLRRLATTDDLTGLHNLRSFEASLGRLVETARAAKASLALLVLDLDHLKSLNDEYGHLAGAEAVRTVGRIIAEHLPDGALACRYGGDEFVIACPDASAARAAAFAGALCRAVRASSPVLAGVAFEAGTLSVSIGMALRQFRGTDRDGSDSADEIGEALFRSADGALYLAKRRGRDQVCVA